MGSKKTSAATSSTPSKASIKSASRLPKPLVKTKPTKPSKKSAQKSAQKKKLTSLQRLRRRKLNRLRKDGQVIFNQRDFRLLFNELGFPGGFKLQGRTGVENFSEEEEWKPGFYIWEIGQPWKMVMENYESGGIHFVPITELVPPEIISCLTESEFNIWLHQFLKLDQPIALHITPKGRLSVKQSPATSPLDQAWRQLADQITKNSFVQLDQNQLQQLFTRYGLPDPQQHANGDVQVTSSTPSPGFLISWQSHQITLSRPSYGGVQANHNGGNQKLADQFSGAYFFNWLGQILNIPGDVFAELTDDGHLRIEKR